MAKIQDILGMNARNISYVTRSNSRTAIRIANNKILTKRILLKNDIPTPILYASIKSTKDLDEFNWDILPERFVIKPNQGLGGEGILVIQKREWNDQDKEYRWFTASGNSYSIDDLKRHIFNILDGNFSMSNEPDIAFFEKRIVNHSSIRGMSYKGVPDIRIIVYNNVPVMAMMRLPTKKSNSKANLAQGAIGVGIDLATGITTTASIKKPRRKNIDKHPDTAEDLRDFQIPFWDQILEIAIRCQKLTGLGFLGADIALDKEMGPVVLELNARAGLEIQVVNRAGLAARLNRVKGLKIRSVQKGISVAKELFGGDIERRVEDISGKNVIGIIEPARIRIGKGRYYKVLAQIDLSRGLTAVREKIINEFDIETANRFVEERNGKRKTQIEFYLDENKISTTAQILPDDDLPYSLVIGRRDVVDYFIDPSKKKVKEKDSKEEKNTLLDKKLYTISKQITILNNLKPNNIDSENKLFFKSQDYNPQFTYNKINFDIIKLKKSLNLLKFDDSLLGRILKKKRDEDFKKLQLLQNIGSEHFSRYAEKLFGFPDRDLIEYAWTHYLQKDTFEKEHPSKMLKLRSIIMAVKKRMDQYGFPYKIVIDRKLHTRILTSAINNVPTIIIKKNARFTAEELEGTLAHEIDSHMLRRQNAHEQKYKIFHTSFAGYRSAEEGLAMVNKDRIYHNPRKYNTAALFVIATEIAQKSSFRDTYNELLTLGLSEKSAWNITFKVKRGLTDTSQPGSFPKYALYLKGKREILEFVERGGDLKKLYIGKIGIRDLKTITQLKGVKPPRYLPEYLQE